MTCGPEPTRGTATIPDAEPGTVTTSDPSDPAPIAWCVHRIPVPSGKRVPIPVEACSRCDAGCRTNG